MRFFATTALAAILAAPGLAAAQTTGEEQDITGVQVEGQETASQQTAGQQASPATEATEQAEALPAERAIPLNEWRERDLYADGWSADDFLDEMDVHGPDGEEIGDVEDIIVDADGKIVAIIAEVGGLWGIGATHVSIPWDQVEVDRAEQRVHVPVTEQNVDDYDPFTHGLPAIGHRLEAEQASQEVAMGVDDVPTGPRAFRLSELIGDYARIRGEGGEMGQQQTGQTGQMQARQTEEQQTGQTGQMQPQAGQTAQRPPRAGEMGAAGGRMTNYGYVSDVLIQDDRVAAVIVEPRGAYGPGYYAYPYYGYGYGWTPGTEYYDLPYGEEEVREQERFEYTEIEGVRQRQD